MTALKVFYNIFIQAIIGNLQEIFPSNVCKIVILTALLVQYTTLLVQNRAHFLILYKFSAAQLPGSAIRILEWIIQDAGKA